jgi:hypothetical protein
MKTGKGNQQAKDRPFGVNVTNNSGFDSVMDFYMLCTLGGLFGHLSKFCLQLLLTYCVLDNIPNLASSRANSRMHWWHTLT